MNRFAKFALLSLLLLPVLLFQSACTVSNTKPENKPTQALNQSGEDATTVEQTTETEEIPTRADRIYYFQHRIIPQWVYQSEGAFYADLRVKNIEQLLDAATQIVDQDFANGLEIRPLENTQAVLIVFPQPEAPPQCYFALVIKQAESFRYTTYESTSPLLEQAYGVVGGWTREGEHLNFGARSYTEAEAFVEDILSNSIK